MTIREIYSANDPRLRQKARPVRQFGPDLRALANDMLETMHTGNGVGLAAPQIGLLHRMLVAHLPKNEEDPQSGKDYVLINPQVVEASPARAESVEGCLSMPTWFGRVPRREWVVVKARNVQGKPIRIQARGFLARVFQHEMDHLDGVLFTDYITNPENLWQEKPGAEADEASAEPALSPKESNAKPQGF